jgi:hypothetical protein
VQVGDLISFKPKHFGDDDWSNPGIVIDSYVDGAGGLIDKIWIVWIQNQKYLLNERNDDVVQLTSSSQKGA